MRTKQQLFEEILNDNRLQEWEVGETLNSYLKDNPVEKPTNWNPRRDEGSFIEGPHHKIVKTWNSVFFIPNHSNAFLFSV
jgi:hypothetical protein